MAAGQLVYLTADSPNTLTHLDKESVYIIGGLVDRNAQKGMCLKKANVRNPCISSSVVPRHLALYERMMERCVVIIQRVYPWFGKHDLFLRFSVQYSDSVLFGSCLRVEPILRTKK